MGRPRQRAPAAARRQPARRLLNRPSPRPDRLSSAAGAAALSHRSVAIGLPVRGGVLASFSGFAHRTHPVGRPRVIAARTNRRIALLEHLPLACVPVSLRHLSERLALDALGAGSRPAGAGFFLHRTERLG